MTTQPNDGLNYLDLYPRMREKLNQCFACQRLGLKPDLPRFPAQGSLRHYFPEMSLNGDGLCEQCEDSIRAKLL